MNKQPTRMQLFSCPKCHALYPIEKWNSNTGKCKQCSRSKYNNQLIYEDEICFRSLLEHRYYLQKKLELAQGLIRNLKVHTRYPLIYNGISFGSYTDDFSFDDVASGRHLIVDTKGYRTELFILKKGLMQLCYNADIIEIREV